MEINEQNIQALTHYLEATLSPDEAAMHEAEAFLKSLEGNEGYALLLLHTMQLQELAPHIRQAAAITVSVVPFPPSLPPPLPPRTPFLNSRHRLHRASHSRSNPPLHTHTPADTHNVPPPCPPPLSSPSPLSAVPLY